MNVRAENYEENFVFVFLRDIEIREYFVILSYNYTMSVLNNNKKMFNLIFAEN